MKTRTFRSLAVALLSLVAAATFADSSEELYVESGARFELEQLAPAVIAQIEAGGGFRQFDTEQFPEGGTMVRDAVMEAFAEPAMREHFIFAIRQRLSEAERARILDFVTSPVGRLVTVLEDEAARPEAVGALQEFIQAGTAAAAPPERRKLLESLDRAARITETSVDVFLGVQRGAYAGVLAMVPMTPDEYAAQLDAITAELDAIRPQITPQLADYIRAQTAFVYRDAGDHELRVYLDFLESETGRRYTSVISAALNEALFEAGGRFGVILMRRFGTQAGDET